MYIELLNKMSEPIRIAFLKVDMSMVEEIRMRKNMPLAIYNGQGYMFITPHGEVCTAYEKAYIVTQKDIERTMELLCGASIYSFQEQIKSGFITTDEGHRVGIAGRAVLENDKIVHIKDISGFNFRIARQKKDAAANVIEYIIQNDVIKNALIISPPGYGKTTMIRDIARRASNSGIKTTIIDERSEIAAMTADTCGYDIGIHTDVIDACPKVAGIMLAIRSLSPQLIVCDEIGCDNDIYAIKEALRCGVHIVTSIHSKNVEELFLYGKNTKILELFDLFITIDRVNGQRVNKIQTCAQVKNIMHNEMRGIRYA